MRVLLWLVLLGLTAPTGGRRAEGDGCPRTYVVSPAGATLPRLDGAIGEGEWPADRWESGLEFPWRDEPAPGTSFVILAHGGSLSFAFRVEDEDVVLADGPAGDESLVARGDRVELFFARDPELDDYYSLEIDPRGRVLDYRARHYREFDFDWDCPGLEVAAWQRPGGYDVEGRLAPSALEEMGVTLGSASSILAGVFRGEFSHGEGGAIHESWISWVDPGGPKPDFHVPSAFGCLQMSSGAR